MRLVCHLLLTTDLAFFGLILSPIKYKQHYIHKYKYKPTPNYISNVVIVRLWLFTVMLKNPHIFPAFKHRYSITEMQHSSYIIACFILLIYFTLLYCSVYLNGLNEIIKTIKEVFETCHTCVFLYENTDPRIQ